MSILARKKIVFVIVEGPSDEEALGIFFEQLFDKNKVFINIVRSNLDGFIEFMTKSDFSVNIDYIKSWNFIMEGGHSLKRYTNFNLCILNAINETLSK